ncbi:MAG: DUF4011 domain-containing protein, partial [Alphaproteobacteria bacterium]
ATIDRVPALLEDVRRRLLETGTRNRLIHVNRKAARANALNVVNERTEDVYAILKTAARRMRFRALGKDRTDDPDGPVLAEEEVDIQVEARHQDAYLDTVLGPDSLQKRLLRLANEAKVAEEEQGVNILYLALGFLTWFEDERSTVAREAPLILLPVELVRNERGPTFDIRVRDDDLVTNLPLQERLKADFGIQLPKIEEGEDLTPESYFKRVEDSVGEMKRWKVDRDGIQLGFFSFAKLLMLRDLDPANWPDGALGKLDIVRRLLKDGFEQDSPLFAPEDRLDDKLDPGDILHVVDADASQTKVIEEVRKGRNLVVQGPPGTGKSQTITNIIAAAVHDGLLALSRMAKPSVAVIEGFCIGGGVALALACDIRLASQDAQFAVTPAKLGIVYNIFDTRLLVDAVGASAARDILFTARIVDAAHALRIRLIDEAVPAVELDGLAKARCDLICGNSQWSVQQAKQMVRRALDGQSVDDPITRQVSVTSFTGPAFARGRAAFLAKQRPDFGDD